MGFENISFWQLQSFILKLIFIKKDNNLAESLITVQKEEKSDAEKTIKENEEKDQKEEKEEKKADTVEETNERRRKKESSDGEGLLFVNFFKILKFFKQLKVCTVHRNFKLIINIII